MRATKKQIAVIVILNLVIAALIGVLIWLRVPARSASGAVDTGSNGGNGDDDNTQVVTPPAHEKLRDATAGKVKEILHETRLMGSGDDTVVFSHAAGGVTYVFGNAAVKDYDFDTSGGFLCRINSDGKIEGFTYFDGRLTAAGVIEGGFGVATVTDAGTEAEKSLLFGVDDEGNKTELAELDGIAVDVFSVSSKITAVVTQPSSGTLKLTEFNRAGGGWAVGSSTRISSGLDIEYFDCYMMKGQYIIAARAYSSPRYDAAVFYMFKAGGDAVPHYYGGNDDSMVRPFDVLPYGDGFMIVCERKGETSVVTMNYDFTDLRISILGVKADSAELLYCNKKYYACITTASECVTYGFDELFTRTEIKEVGGSHVADVINMDSPLFICDESEKVTATDGISISASLGIKDAKINRVFKTGYNRFTVVLSARGGSALSASTGGTDVYVIEVKL